MNVMHEPVTEPMKDRELHQYPHQKLESKTFGFRKHELTLIIPDTNPNNNIIQID